MLLSGFYFQIFNFSPESSKCSKISLFQFYRNSVRTLTYEKRGIIPWVVCTHHKAVSRKASPQYLSEDMSCFPTGLNVSPNVPSRIHLWLILIHLWCRINPMTNGMQTSQRSSSELFSPVSIRRDFRFHRKPQGALKYSLADSLKECSNTVQWKQKVNCANSIHVT